MTFDPKVINDIKFDEKGLVPAIAQDYKTGEVLMFAWMNKESLQETVKTNFAHYFSRSRNKLWKKGETSGHVQEVKEILIDCDNDCLILKIKQTGVACHTGARTCFFRNLFPVLVLLLAVISTSAHAAPRKVDRLTIFSENGLSYPLVKISRLYSEKKNTIVSVSFDSPTMLIKSINEGEPADIFISSHNEWIESLKQRGLIDAYQSTHLARDRMVLIASQNHNKISVDDTKNISMAQILKIIDERKIPLIVDAEETLLGKDSNKILGDFKNNKNVYRRVLEDKKSVADVVNLSNEYCGITLQSAIVDHKNVVVLKEIEGSEIYYQALVVAGESMKQARDFLKFTKSNEVRELLTKSGLKVE